MAKKGRKGKIRVVNGALIIGTEPKYQPLHVHYSDVAAAWDSEGRVPFWIEDLLNTYWRHINYPMECVRWDDNAETQLRHLGLQEDWSYDWPKAGDREGWQNLLVDEAMRKGWPG